MNKKFLSAILFGALMVSSTGTFVSCKDYDDDIENLQGQITANADAIKALQDLVGSGKYVTSVAKTADGHGITFTFNQGDPVTITLDDETGSGDVVKVVDGILYINDEPQELKVATSETKPSIIMQDGVWAVLQEDGTYKSTGVPVSGVSVAGSEADGFTLTIFDKDGNKQEVKVPSASSLVTSIAIAVPVVEDEASLLNEKNVVYYGSKELINVSEVKYPKDAIISALNEDGTRGVAVNVVVTPTNIDPADLKFNLVNSEGATIFEEAVVSTPKGALQRAAMDGVYTLHFALKEGVTVADIKKGSIISQDDALAVVCGKAATAFEYKAGLENAATTQGKTTGNYEAKDNTYVKLGETYSLFGKGYAADPSANPNAAAQAFLTKLEGVSDIALSLDENLKSLYGITIDGTNFTISNEAAYGKEITFTVKYTNSASVAKNSIQSANLKVTVQKAAVTAGVTLKASHILSTDATKNTVYLPLADLAASVTAAGDKIVWNNANAFTYKTVANNTPADGFALTSSKKYGATPANLKIAKDTELGGFTLVKSDKKTDATKLSEAAYLAITVDPEQENVTADVYSALIQFVVTGNDVDGQSKTLTLPATVELTLTNPTSAVSRIPMYFDGDKLAAYGAVPTGANLLYDVRTAYNNADKAEKFTVTAKADKDEWNVQEDNHYIVEIPLDELYTETQKFEVSYQHFAGAINNVTTETIYITGQSPIKDGTITVSKTTLDLATGSDSFLSADVAGKDAFNKAYKLLNSFTAEVLNADGTVKTAAAAKDVQDTRIDDIKLVATGENAGAFEVTYVYKKIKDGKLVNAEDTDADAKLVGWTIALKPNTAIQNGATITFDLNITDKWGVELPAQKVSLTVKK